MDPAERSLDNVAGALSGRQEGGKRASGRLCKWSASHRWVERAAAFDAHLEGKRLDGAAASARSRGAVWEQRRAHLHEQEFKLGRALMRESAALIRRYRETVDGLAPGTEPPDPAALRRASLIALAARELARGAITAAAPDLDSTVGGLDILTLSEAPEVRARAESDVEEWRRQKMPAVLELLNSRNPMLVQAEARAARNGEAPPHPEAGSASAC
jgi:hypothetical protein